MKSHCQEDIYIKLRSSLWNMDEGFCLSNTWKPVTNRIEEKGKACSGKKRRTYQKYCSFEGIWTNSALYAFFARIVWVNTQWEGRVSGRKCDLSVKFDSTAGIATGYGLEDLIIRFRFPVEAGNISLRHHVHTGSGTHPASYPMGTGVSFPGGKAAGAWSIPLTSI
jgi:hypothetical protein